MSPAAQRQTAFESQIGELAAQAGVTLEAAGELYRGEVEQLRRGARITDFVPLLATRRLHQELRRRRVRGISIGNGSGGLAWSRHELEAFEQTLTVAELTRQDTSRCNEILGLLKTAREDPKVFARFGHEEQQLVVQLIDRFDGFC